ncbi:MAG: hypothetical protein LBT89_04520 [Planctomycetaceae bacterium]|jgi:tetratricopeptide (TPR) repeat protein|nr:hypothetical protein [Planctomycetaceae bacterium]
MMLCIFVDRKEAFAMNTAVRLRYRFLIIFAGILLFNSAIAADRDPVRQDVITFSGIQPASEQSLTPDSYIVPLRCKTAVTKQYSVIIRNVDPVERALLLDAADGRWNHFDLFRAALIVEGIRDPELIKKYEDRLNRLVAEIKAKLQINNTLTPQVLTKELFEAMHREILTKDYSIDCTEVGKVMATGHFNCVSATVLFNCLAEKAGLDVYALEMPGHALSRVKFGGNAMDLETTCPTWFALKSNAERFNATMLRAGPQAAPVNPQTGNNAAGNTEEAAPLKPIENLEDLARGLREISPVQLTATIYYNIGVDKHAQKQFAEAAAANVKAMYLDPENQTAWGNLMAAINNWSLELTSVKGEERFDIAAILLDQGLTLDPSYKNFKTNQLHVFYHWIYGLAMKRRFSDARTVFQFADVRLPNDTNLAALMAGIDKEVLKQEEREQKEKRGQ